MNHAIVTRRHFTSLGMAAGVGLATATVATPRAHADNADSVSIGTHNTFNGAGSFPAFVGVIGWQEVYHEADRDRMRSRLGPGYSHAVFSGPASAMPISWNSRFTKVAESSVKTHDREPGVTPERHVNAVVLRNTQTGMRFIFLTTHFISGAWDGTHPDRQPLWNRHLAVLTSEITRLRALHHAPVVVVGDFNRRRAERLPGLRMLEVVDVSRPTVDQIYVPVDAMSTRSQQLPKFGSDHHAYKARVDW